MSPLEQLENEVYRLEEENRIFRNALSEDFTPPLCLKIRPAELTILRCLLKREIVSFETMKVFLYGEDGDDKRDVYNSITIHVCNLRKRLAVFGISIKNEAMRGYRMAVEDKQKLRAL